MGPNVFIRDDDAHTLNKAFRFYFDAAMDRGLPIVYAVIPGKMDERFIRFLRRAKERTPRLLDIVQHGWIHANHSVRNGTKYEFGTGRSLNVQRDDIRQGQMKMSESFGDLCLPAFVPPYHGFDERTLRVINEEGFKVFSAGGRRPGSRKQFLQLPAEISFSRYDEGRTSVYKAADVLGLLAKGISRRAISGLLTHHADFKTSASRKELTRFFDFLAALKSKKEWRVVLFSDVLSGLSS
ncbi:MAG: DUF2334 domain-containing protein [Candidatus Omnitrophica bacterium]|nr:DUF2334 domain-containing protein [Candidatus Omnitrophota bacterium]